VLADPVLKRVRKLAQLDGAAAHFILKSRLNGDHDLLLGRDGLRAGQSDGKNVRSPVANPREAARLFYGTLTCRLRFELLPQTSLAIRVHYFVFIY
jgi:hypothetical protein